MKVHKISTFVMIFVFCYPLLSVSATPTSNPAPSWAYPSGSSGCGSIPESFCTGYYAETHLNGRVYWAPVFSDSSKITIGTVEGTYSYIDIGAYDTWELERVQVWNGSYLGGTKVYDNTSHDGEKRKFKNSIFWESYAPSVVVESNSNFVLLNFELKLYTQSGTPSQTFYPVRAVTNITRT